MNLKKFLFPSLPSVRVNLHIIKTNPKPRYPDWLQAQCLAVYPTLMEFPTLVACSS